MKISIVVPIYNAEQYLNDCILSVLGQTDDRWELILVDDGSTDNGLEICEQYAQRYPDKVKCFYKKNEGQFLTRRYGIAKCSGEYIGFLDSDDFLDQEYVSSLLSIVERSEGLDVICFGFYEWNQSIFKETSVSTSYQEYLTKNEYRIVFKKIVEGNLTGSLWSKIFKREMLISNDLDIGVVKEKRYAEDAYQSFDVIFKAQKIAFLNASLYYYRMNPQGFSRGFEYKQLNYFNSKYVYELISKNLEVFEEESEDLRKQLYARNFNETVYYMLRFYRSAQNSVRRREVIQYDWTSYMLNNEDIDQNEYIRHSYKKVWNAFLQKRYFEIFIRERFKKFIGW